ncbi:MAG: YegS/Rv2252/BmrU family lipid kinase [Chlorobiota bacterium]|nr:MAG: YegS/Rv2252/BmrU family lipid kinase [Chlorobiota bacterium]
MSYLFVINKTSNRSCSIEEINILLDLINNKSDCNFKFTEFTNHAKEITINAIIEGYQNIIACGGDGTVHEVINGIMNFEKSLRPNFGCIPIGSGNDFAYGLNLDFDLKNAFYNIFNGGIKAIDVGEVISEIKTEFFNNTVGIGFDANVTIQSRKIKKLRGVFIYLLAVLQTLKKNFNFYNSKIFIDNELTIDTSFFMLTLGNGPREGGGFITTPNSMLDDGVFEYMLVPKLKKINVLKLLPKVMKGNHVSSGMAQFGKFKQMRIVSNSCLPVHLDGEIFSTLSDFVMDLKIEIKVASINILY